MQEYTSRQQQIRRSAQQIYDVVSRFDNLTPALADRVEEWQADEDTCSFKAKGFTVKLRIAEKEAPKTIKIVGGDGGVPMISPSGCNSKRWHPTTRGCGWCCTST